MFDRTGAADYKGRNSKRIYANTGLFLKFLLQFLLYYVY